MVFGSAHYGATTISKLCLLRGKQRTEPSFAAYHAKENRASGEGVRRGVLAFSGVGVVGCGCVRLLPVVENPMRKQEQYEQI